ncbi:unnamed protein product [Thlaspi arvense]|uniref:Uncharacterized protein n=1 Tax=Thlaspi arvense TaxID=13288 RepID=A0AAU9RW59_THLAR|nr:unnamed protein product [Thlaspi arvense]
MASTTKEVATELLPLLRVYTDGTVERLVGSPFVAAGVDPATGSPPKTSASHRMCQPDYTFPNSLTTTMKSFRFLFTSTGVVSASSLPSPSFTTATSTY